MSETKVIPTGCCHDCGGRCPLSVHVRGGKIVAIEGDSSDEPYLRACLRGRAYRQRVYSPDRLKHPLKRTGNRGEGKFAQISWDEALDTVASNLKRVKEQFGPASILCASGSGNQGILHGAVAVERMLAAFGGYTRTWAAPSYEGALYASMTTYGTLRTGSSWSDLVNSKLVIMWGWNPAETIWDAGTIKTLIDVKEAGVKIVSVDPRLTDTTAVLADQWIPIRPGTDIAMLLAMAYVIISKNLHHRQFIDKYTTGFEQFAAYIIGGEDGQPKSPSWAEEITGVAASTIENLAVEYAASRPAALIPGWGPGRTALGEQYHRAANILIAITGNLGLHGGFAGGFMRSYPSRELGLPRGQRNQVEIGAPNRKYSLPLPGGTGRTSARVHDDRIFDAILKGKQGGYPCDPKLAYIVAMNLINSRSNTNKGIEALNNLEFIVIHEQFLTPTAKYADIVLPVNTFMERSDIAVPWLGSPYYIYMNKAIDSLHESKTDWEICAALAPRLDIKNFGEEKSEDEWLQTVCRSTGEIPDYQEFKKKGVHKINLKEPIVSFKKQIEDPENNPFPTPSGKIELYSDMLADMNSPLIPPVPKLINMWEGYNDPLRKKYPLQLITPHLKRRAHSTLDNIPWLKELEPQTVWINTEDARARGVANGERVLIFNDRGKVLIPAKVTERIMPGVVSICEGAWYQPDENGIDRGGCANVLTNDLPSPGGAVPCNTALVEVSKFGE